MRFVQLSPGAYPELPLNNTEYPNALADPVHTWQYVWEHAQEMELDILQKHIGRGTAISFIIEGINQSVDVDLRRRYA